MKTTRIFMTLLAGTAMLLSGCKKDDAERPTYTVTVADDGNGTAQADITTAEAGTTVTLTATAKNGYKFKRWTVESGSVTLAPDAQTNPATFTMPESNVSVKAEFMEDAATTYTVTVTNDGNGSAQADITTAEAGETVTVTATANNGYTFKRWTVESGSVTLAPDAQTSPATFTMPESNVSVKAEFMEEAATTYTITVTNDGNGAAQADVSTAEAGTTVTLTAKPAGGYVFKQWTVESGSVTLAPDAQTNPATFTMPESNVSVKAEFTAYGGPDIETVPIPAGTFLMGETGVDEPVHTVTLTQDFRMSKYEITNTQYAEFLNVKGIPGTEGGHAYYDGQFIVAECTWGENAGKYLVFDASSNAQSVREDWGINWDEDNSRWKPAPGYENHPAIWVTWYGAYEYAVWAGGALPTEAQWEYACRAGTTTSYYFGNDSNDMDDYGWAYENSGGRTHEVGQKLPNAYGLYDMHGNAEEWVYDWYEKYSGNDATDPAGPASGTQRVLRGGVYNFYARDCKSAYRDLKEPHHGWDYYGFRVVFMP